LAAGALAVFSACGGSDEPTYSPTLPAGAGGSWETMEPIPTARAEVGTAELDGKIYVVGGFPVNAPTDKVEVYDAAADSWEEVADLPQWRHHASGGRAGRGALRDRRVQGVRGGAANNGVPLRSKVERME
jgi:hypothetical protein